MPKSVLMQLLVLHILNVDCTYYDALYLSPHKLLGGPGSCGLLVIRNNLVDIDISPTFAGGGTVSYVNATTQEYEKNITARETAGTPGILQLIKAALAYKLRNEIGFDFYFKSKRRTLKSLFRRVKKCT